MKNIWKVLAAMMVIALPFVVSSCSSDDDDNGPWTLTYNWKWENVDFTNITPDSLYLVASTARVNINNQIANAYKNAGFQVNSNEYQFSIVITTNDDLTIAQNDLTAQTTFTNLAITPAFQEQVKKIPGDPKMYIWRDGKEIIQHISIKTADSKQ